MADVDLERQLVDYVDATTTPVTHPAPLRTEMIMLAPDRNEPSRRIWMSAAAAAAAIIAVGALVFAATRDGDSEPADEPPPATSEQPAPETTVAVGPREQAAIDAAAAYWRAWSDGDADAVLAASDTTELAVQKEAELVPWWAGAAWPDGSTDRWPSGPCRIVGTGLDGDAIPVECQVAVPDPVAVALDRHELLWTVDVNDDGTIRRRAEPMTALLSNYTPVWSAYADYLSMFRPDEYAAACDPAAFGAGEIFDQAGLALTGECAALTSAASADVAAWIAADRPEPPAVDEPADEPEVVDEALTTEALVGYWANVDGWTALFADFRRDGTFTIGNTGRLDGGAFTGGTYAVENDQIVFTGIGGGCDGERFVWRPTAFGGGALDVDVTPNGGCASLATWSWVRVSPASPASLDLQPGDREVTPAAPAEIRDVVGIWVRLGSGDVLAIESDGTYLFTTDGDTLEPTDRGQLTVDALGELVFTSNGAGACAAGDTWRWADVTTAADLIREGNPRGTTMRTTASAMCSSANGGTVWRLLSPDVPG